MRGSRSPKERSVWQINFNWRRQMGFDLIIFAPILLDIRGRHIRLNYIMGFTLLWATRLDDELRWNKTWWVFKHLSKVWDLFFSAYSGIRSNVFMQNDKRTYRQKWQNISIVLLISMWSRKLNAISRLWQKVRRTYDKESMQVSCLLK